MLEPTKRPHTDGNSVEICFVGPAAKLHDAVQALQELGFEEKQQGPSWRDALPAIKGLPDYSIALRGGRHKEGLTQKQLAQAAGIPQAYLSRMENGKLSIGKERARRLGQALRMDYRLFM